MTRTLPLLALSLLCLAAAPFGVAAPAPELLPVSYFMKDSDIGSAVLSPNGRYLATTARKSGTLQLALVDLETSEAKALMGYKELDIANVTWIGNERIAYSVIDRSSPGYTTQGGLYAIARTGGRPVVMLDAPGFMAPRAETDIGGIQLIRPLKADPNKYLALGGIVAGGDARPLVVDTLTGRRRELAYDLPGKPLNFLFDSHDLPRVALVSATDDLKTLAVWYCDPATGKWRELATFPALEPRFTPVAMIGDTLYVVARGARFDSLYKYDLANNQLGELVFADENAHLEGALVTSPDGSRLLGVRVQSEPLRTHWFDAPLAALQRAVDARYPQHANVILPGEPDSPRLIISYSSTDPGRYLRHDPATRQLTTLFSIRPWVDPEKMAEQLVFDYQARDGLPIMAYLTLPKGRDPKGLPLIVLPHGGPHARDHWGFSPDVQLLANRGYAVFQPQFRGSSGFGLQHVKKGFHQWGLAMQDDLNDGVDKLVAQGLVDPSRVCIAGYSYGGYATMMGLARDAARYRCGINMLGVTDLAELIDKGRWIGGAYRHSIHTTVADPVTMKEQIRATSPVHHAARIQAPVLMAYGERDRRVPLEHGTGMRAALKKAGKSVEWMSFPDEEHGFVKVENRIKLFTAIDAFLAKHNPAGANAPPQVATPSGSTTPARGTGEASETSASAQR